MKQTLVQQPDSPNGAFSAAVESLKDTLSDEAVAVADIAEAFVKVLELLDCVAVEKPIYAAAKAVLVSGFRAVCREVLDGKNGMGVRHGSAKDIDLHGKKVARNAWL
jgi:hypothetical protein